MVAYDTRRSSTLEMLTRRDHHRASSRVRATVLLWHLRTGITSSTCTRCRAGIGCHTRAAYQ